MVEDDVEEGSLKEKYYQFMDWLEDHNVKSYDYFVNPLEDNNIPSFPVFVAICLIFALGVGLGFYYLFSSSGVSTYSFTVSFNGSKDYTGSATIILGGQTYTKDVTNSKAVFANLPDGLADITAQLDGEASDLRASGVATSLGEYVFQVGALGFSGEPSELKIQVSDSQTSKTIQNAKVTTYSSANPNPTSKTTLQDGVVSFMFNQGDVVQVSISANGYQTSIASVVLSKKQHTLDVHLNPKVSCTGSDCNKDNQKVDVRVQLQDSNSQNLNLENAKVRLMYVDSDGQTHALTVGGQNIEKTTDATGSTYFENLSIVGLEVFVAVLPPDSSGYAVYNGVSDSQVATTSTPILEFTPQLAKSSDAADCKVDPTLAKCKDQIFSNGKIKLTVLDSTDGTPISGASVNLYYDGGISPVPFQDKTTDSDGNVEWIAASGTYYATIIMTGYLPGLATTLTVGSNVTLKLQKALVGNNQQLQVLVTDDDDNPVQGAEVSLYYAGTSGVGLATGLTQSTGTDGFAYFDSMPIDNSQYKAMALLGSKTGSTTFKMDFANPKQVTVKIEPQQVPYSVLVKDAITRNVIAGALVVVNQKTQLQNTTDANGLTSFNLDSQVDSTLSASASGYLNYVDLSSFVLQPGTKTSRTIYLTPSSFQNGLKASLTVSQTLGATDDAMLVRGQYYNLKLSLSTPANGDYALGFVRIGDAQTAGDEEVYITQPDSTLQNPSGLSGISGLRKVTFGDIAPCSVGGSVDSFKWVAVNYTPSVSATTINPSIIYVNPVGSQKKIRIYYGALVLRGKQSVLYEYPDTANTYDSAKDVCIASLSYKDYAIQAQDSTCNDKACLSAIFNGANGKNNQAVIGQQYVLNVKASEYQDLKSPSIRIIDESKNLVFNSYSLTDANGGPTLTNPSDSPIIQDVNMTPFVADINALPQTPALIDLTLTPKSKATSSILTVQLFSEDNLILQKRLLIKISGNQLMQVTLLSIDSPSAQPGNIINVNEPAYITYKLTKTIADEQGVFEPITDAFAQPQNKDLNNKPFGAITQAGLQGDDSTNKGEDGVYKILVQPLLPGLFNVQFTEKNYIPITSQDISVIASQFLQVEPDENVGLSLSGETCNADKAQKIKLYNTLAAAINVTIQPDVAGCLMFSAPGLTCNAATGVCTFKMSKGSFTKPLLKTISVYAGVNPSPNCFIQITALVPGAAGAGSQAVLNVPVQQTCVSNNYTNATLAPFAKLCVTDDDCGPYASTGTCQKQSCLYNNTGPTNQIGGCPFYGAQPNYCTSSGNCNVGVCNCNDIVTNKYLEGFSDKFLTYYLLNEFTGSNDPKIANPADSPYISISDYGMQNTGVSSTTLSIDPLSQSDGFAITFDNQASRSMTISTQLTGANSQCLVFSEDVAMSGKSLISYLYVKNLFDWLGSSSSFSTSGLSISAGKAKTFTVLFDTSRPGCDYDSLKSSTVTLSFSSLGSGTQKTSINILVNKLDSEQLKALKKIQIPSNSAVIPRRIKESQEPFLTVDNSKKLDGKFAYIDTNKPQGFTFNDPTTTSSLKGDVLGSLIDNNKDVTQDCQKNDYCISKPTFSEYSGAANTLLASKNPSTLLSTSTSAGKKMLQSAVAALYDTANELCTDVNALYCLFNMTPGVSNTGNQYPTNAYNPMQNPFASGYYGSSSPYGYIGYPQQNPFGYGQNQFGGGFQGFGQQDPLFGYSGCNFQQALDLICNSLRSPTRFRSQGASRVLSILGGSFVTSLCRANILSLVYEARSVRQVMPGQYGQYGGPIPGILGPGYDTNSFATGLSGADRKNFDTSATSKAFSTSLDVHVPYKYAGDTGGFRVSTLRFTFGEASKFEVKEDKSLNDYASSISTVKSLKGYPYVSCFSGTCQVKYDSYKPTLFSFAKYKINNFGIIPPDYSLFNPNDYLKVKDGSEVNLYRCDIIKTDPVSGLPVYLDPENCKLPSNINMKYAGYLKEGKALVGVHVTDNNVYFITNSVLNTNLEEFYVNETKNLFEYFYTDSNQDYNGQCKNVRESDENNLILSCELSVPPVIANLFAYIYNESSSESDDFLNTDDLTSSTVNANVYSANKPVYLWVGYNTTDGDFSDLKFKEVKANSLTLDDVTGTYTGKGTYTDFQGTITNPNEKDSDGNMNGYLKIDPQGVQQQITLAFNVLGKKIVTTINFTASVSPSPPVPPTVCNVQASCAYSATSGGQTQNSFSWNAQLLCNGAQVSGSFVSVACSGGTCACTSGCTGMVNNVLGTATGKIGTNFPLTVTLNSGTTNYQTTVSCNYDNQIPPFTPPELDTCIHKVTKNFDFTKADINWIQLNQEATWQEYKNAILGAKGKKLTKSQRKTVRDYNVKEVKVRDELKKWNRADPISIKLVPDPNPQGSYEVYLQDLPSLPNKVYTRSNNYNGNSFTVPPGSNGPFKVIVAVRDPVTHNCTTARYWSRVNTVIVK